MRKVIIFIPYLVYAVIGCALLIAHVICLMFGAGEWKWLDKFYNDAEDWFDKLEGKVVDEPEGELNDTHPIPSFHSHKRYSEMTRRERREYKRWLVKNDMWDGEIVAENIKKQSK